MRSLTLPDNYKCKCGKYMTTIIKKNLESYKECLFCGKKELNK